MCDVAAWVLYSSALLLYRDRLSGVRNIFRRCYFIVHIRSEQYTEQCKEDCCF